MNTKTLLAALVGSIASFFLGWLIFGMLLASYAKDHTVVYAGLMKDNPSLIPLIIANCCGALLIAMICSWSNMVGLMKGAVIGATVGFLVELSYDTFTVAFMNLYTDNTYVIVDVIASTIFMAVIGAIIGWMMGMGNKSAAA